MAIDPYGTGSFRSYIAGTAPEFLPYVGNDGGINAPKLQKAGGVESSYRQMSLTPQGAANTIAQLARKYQQQSGASGGGSGGGVSGGGGGGGGIDPGSLALYDQAIGNTQAAINRLTSQHASGQKTINSSYQDAINQLLSGKNQAESTYKTEKTQTAQDFVGGKNTIRSNAGTSLNSLLRILGARGAGGGSAATISAPGAVAREATIQQNDLGQTFGRNNQALDTNWGNYLTGFKNEVSSAKNQRRTQLLNLRQSIRENKANLLQSLAQLVGEKAAYSGGNVKAATSPYLSRANSLLNAASKYSISPIKYNVQAYNTPDLGKYTVNPNAAPKFNGQPSSNDYVSPYLAALLGKKQQQTAGV